MRAKYTGFCNACEKPIQPGDEIKLADSIGWLHLGCFYFLDEPISLFRRASMVYQLHRINIHTMRELALYNTNLDAQEDYYDPLFGESRLMDYCD